VVVLEELEAQLAKTPRDASLFAVYADLLAKHDDPRGELISIVLALESDPGNATLRARANALHDEHDATWLGPLANPQIVVRWRRGFVDSVSFGGRVPALDVDEVVELYRAMRARPICGLVRSLSFGPLLDDSDEPDFSEIVEAIASEGAAHTVRRLAFISGAWDPSACRADSLAPLYAVVPKLHALRVEMQCSFGAAVELPNLRELDIYASEVADLGPIAVAPWSKLRSLALRYRIDESTSLDNPPHAVLGRSFAALSRLAVTDWIDGDDFVRQLADAPWARQLRTLDLTSCRLSDAVVDSITAEHSALRGLEHLVVSGTGISRDALAALRAVVPTDYAESGSARFAHALDE